MKKNLLSLAMLAGLATSAVNAGEFYLIKDGRLQAGIEVLKYEDDPVTGINPGPVINGEDEWNGEAAYSIKEMTTYNDTRFYIADGLDLSKYWNVEIEFGFNEGELDVPSHGGANKWAAMEIGLVDDTIGGKYGIDDSFIKNLYDVKYKNEAGVWNTETRFLCGLPYKNSFKEVVFAWQRQVTDRDALGPVYIKNLKFTGEGNRPFFAEDFNTEVAYSEAFGPYQTYLVVDGAVAHDVYRANFDNQKNSHSGLPLYCAFNDGAKTNKQSKTYIKRLYEDDGTDGSAYWDVELLHALIFDKVSGNKSGRNGRTFYLVPVAGLETAEGFNFEYLCKWNGSATKEGFDEETEPELRELNVKYAFVNDAIEASTCELTNAFGADDLLEASWTKYSCVIPNAVNGKKYIAIVFDTPVNFSYCIDDLRLTAIGENLSLVTSAAPIVLESCIMEFYDNLACDITDIPSYEFGASQGAAAIIKNAAVKVYPVPATDVVTVANEGVVKVEIVNAAGAVVASANGNKVNVAGINNGIYVIKGYTAEGVLVAKIVKK